MNIKQITRILKSNIIFEPLLFVIDFILFIVDSVNIIESIFLKKIKTNGIVFIKCDVLGDYILSRNFFQAIKTQFPSLDMYLIANEELKSLITEIDNAIFTKIFWLKPYKYASNPIYRYKINKSFYHYQFAIAAAPSYSRILVLEDFIMRVTNAQYKVTQQSDLINQKIWENWWGNLNYTIQINTGKKVIFEFERNKIFYSALNIYIKDNGLVPSESITNPQSFESLSLNIDQKIIENLINPSTLNTISNFIAIAPGAGEPKRIWNPTNFAKIINQITSLNLSLHVVLIGSPSENYLAEEIMKHIDKKENCINLIGKSSISDAVCIIKKAKLLLANESGLIHVAAAIHTPFICISNGNHYIRFNPYPIEYQLESEYYYPFDIDNIDKTELANKFKFGSDLNINLVDPFKLLNNSKILQNN